MPTTPNSNKPSDAFLEKTKKLLNKRLQESAKVVDDKKADWEKYRKLYNNQIKDRSYLWESNLIIPKPHYIVQTITPQILGTVFSSADFMTIKSPKFRDDDLARMSKWFTWFLLKRMHTYVRCVEMFTESPMVGTSLVKLYSSNGIPSMDFLPVDKFYPDPRASKPGDVDSMQFCFNKFERDLGELERATVPRLKTVTVDIETEDPITGEPVMTPTEIPTLVQEAMYFNLKEAWKEHLHKQSETPDGDFTVDLPNLNLVEHWGEIETTFGVYDFNAKSYTPGKYEEYVVTGIVEGNEIKTLIRCEPSTFYYHDPIEGRDKYLKPYVASIYTLNANNFYGMGAIEPVESLISEMKEHHDLYLDEHKRSIMTILSVLERSGLTEKDLPFSPYAHWVMRSHDDVQVVKFPEVNLQAFQTIHSLIDHEIDRTSGSSTLMQGVPTSKRQTLGEVQSLMTEATRRFTVFVKTADFLTLRPLALKTLVLMRSMPTILQGQPFVLPDEEITIDPESLLQEMEFAFAASAMEPEYTKYYKREIFPRLLKEIAGAMQATNGKYMLNLPEILSTMEKFYDVKDMDRYVEEVRPSVPLDLLQAAAGESPELQAAMQQVMGNVQLLAQAEEEEQKGGGGKGE